MDVKAYIIKLIREEQSIDKNDRLLFTSILSYIPKNNIEKILFENNLLQVPKKSFIISKVLKIGLAQATKHYPKIVLDRVLNYIIKTFSYQCEVDCQTSHVLNYQLCLDKCRLKAIFQTKMALGREIKNGCEHTENPGRCQHKLWSLMIDLKQKERNINNKIRKLR